MRISVRIVTASALVLTLGLHWAILQTIAWTGMMVHYALAAPLSQAVAKTFDGKHPCALCKFIKSGRAEEERQERKPVKPAFKLDFGPIWQAAEFTLEPSHIRIPTPDRFGCARTDQPPKPRPRGMTDDPARV